MHVSHLSLHDFRSYPAAEVALDAGVTAFVGRNGQGKTNLVEAIDYLSRLQSHRVATDAPLVRAGADQAVVRAAVVRDGRTAVLEVEINSGKANRARVNRSPLPRTRDLVGLVRTVVFSPEDLTLVKGDPSDRRRFLDDLLVLRAPRLAGVRSDYDRVLKQRNTLLKSARAARVASSQLSTLEVWDERLVDLGSEIIEARGRLVSALRPFVGTAYAAIAGEVHEAELASELSILGAAPDEEVEVSEQTVRTEIDASEAASAFTAALARNRRAELERGLTLTGPHRDDLLLRLNGLPARGYASHGESWSFALALRLASAALLRAESPAGDPVLILDDVFAELDESRRQRLADAVRDYEQVLITAAVESDVPRELASHTVRIRAGRVLDVGEPASEGREP